MRYRGLFVVVEGSDGSGKATQFNLLKERLKATGYDVAIFDFPRYQKDSSYFVKQYLSGTYGSATDISPYTASLFYALDRFEAGKEIQKALNDGKIVLSNRYVGSNMAHQGAKFDDPVEQRGFFVWEDNLEFQLLKIPRPDVSFFLRVPADISHQLIKQRAAKSGVELDGHEKDINFLKKSLNTYDVLCQLFPRDFKAIECTKAGKLQSVAAINNILWTNIKPLLPSEKQHPSHSVVVTLGLDEKPQDSGDSLPDELSHNFKDVSLLLRLQLQRNAHVNVSPPFTRWSDYDFRFYTPQGLPKEIAAKYKQIMEQNAQAQQVLHEKMGQYLETHLLDENNPARSYSITDLLLPLTPLGALSSFKITLKKNDVVSITSQLLTSEIDELQWAAKQLYLAARQKWPQDFDQPLESRDGPVSLNNIIAKLAEERLPQDFSADEAIKLLEARPRLEFDLLAESIYPYTNLSLEEIADEVSNWPYLQKYDSLKAAAAQPQLLKKVRYKLDILSDQVALNEIFKAGNLKEVQVQSFTPRYGFEVPEIIDDAAADDLFNDCFDESLKLYSLMQGVDREDLAPYATLLGHKVRWQLNVDAMGLKHIINNQPQAYHKIAEIIAERIAEVHPLLWEVIRGTPLSAMTEHKNGKNRVKPSKQLPKRNPGKKRR